MPQAFPVANPVVRFEVPLRQPARYVVSGLTIDASGSALASCTIAIYEAASSAFRGSTTSDANGNYSIDVTSAETGLTFQAIATSLDGTKVGATVSTIVGTPQ